MKLPPSFRRFLRKIAQYSGPVGVSTVLRGCPCPNPEFHPPAPYTSSLSVDKDLTLDANMSTWTPYCEKTCGGVTADCSVYVDTGQVSFHVVPQCSAAPNPGIPFTGADPKWVILCKNSCGDEQNCRIGPNPDNNNQITINCVSWWLNCGGGRSTEGVEIEPIIKYTDPDGDLYARMATLEAEAVPAFRRLTHELAALGAPRKLQRKAARSKRDEARHARLMTSLARRYGATPARVLNSNQSLPARPLEEVAFENALEGCVRETYGAWHAFKQAEEARDPEIRALMNRIANDEMRHASLAWDIHTWAMRRFNAPTRQRITQAMLSTWQELAKQHPDARDLAQWALDPYAN